MPTRARCRKALSLHPADAGISQHKHFITPNFFYWREHSFKRNLYIKQTFQGKDI